MAPRRRSDELPAAGDLRQYWLRGRRRGRDDLGRRHADRHRLDRGPSLAYETTYHWRVRAEDAAGKSAWSDAWRFETIPGEPKRYYYVKDHLGSVRVTGNEDGEVVHYDDFYPFGMRMPGRSHIAGMPTRENFTGHELDTETGLLYAGARYMDPVIGRWLSVDPLADQYPGWSPYNYALNNPLTYTDPDGQSPIKGLKAAFNVVKRAYKASRRGESLTSLKTWKNAGVDEVVGIVDNVRTLVDGNLNADDAFAAVDLLTGFGGEAKQGAKALGIIDEAGDAASTAKKLDSDAIAVTLDGVALLKGGKYKIPSEYVENPHRAGSYGVVNENGTFVEKLRVDPATSPGKKGPGHSHYHLEGKGTHHSPNPKDKSDPGFRPREERP